MGILGGILIPSIMHNIAFLGTIYINLLKFMIIPLIFTSIMVSVYNSNKGKSKLLFKTILLFIVMFVATFLLTSLVVWIINPAKGFNYEILKWAEEITPLNTSDIIINLFPSNIAGIIVNNSLFACIMVAFTFGIAATKTKDGKELIKFVDSFKNILVKVLEWIMYLSPIGIFALVGSSIASSGTAIIGAGIRYIGIAYLCSILCLFLVMILPVWLYAKINPLTYIKKVGKVWLVTISTCSSLATLPYTIKTLKESFKVPSDVTDVVAPLGCTIHMCGGAVSFALLGLFCSSLFGVEITLTTYLIMIVSATLINMAAPGIPSGGIILGATYLSMLNIPLLFIGFYSGIYRLLDMSYTTLNVTGDISAGLIINKNVGNK